MSEFDALLYDGQTAGQMEFTVAATPAGLELRRRAVVENGGEPAAVLWSWAEVRQRPPEFPTDPLTFERAATGESLVVNDQRFLAEVRRAAPPDEAVLDARTTGHRLGRLALIAAVSLPFVLYGFWRFIPWFGEQMARVVPVSVEDRMGSSIADYLSRRRDVCQDRLPVDTVQSIADRLHSAGGASPYTIRVRVLRNSDVNAFAAPGGHVVVFRGLLTLTSNESELAGVLAHEIMHVRRRHTTKAIFRQMGIWAGLAVLTGDVSGSVATIAGTAGILQFMREHETEADLAGLELMRAAGYDVAAMGVMFRKLQTVMGDAPKVFSYISTHPDTAERIRAIDKRSGHVTPEKVGYDAGEPWRSIRGACAAAKQPGKNRSAP